MSDITINELIRKKIETEEEIMEAMKGPVERFQKETEVGIERIDVTLVCTSNYEEASKYVVTDVTIKLDLDFIEALDRIDRRISFDRPKQLTLFDTKGV